MHWHRTIFLLVFILLRLEFQRVSCGAAKDAALYSVKARDSKGVKALLSMNRQRKLDLWTGPKTNKSTCVLVMSAKTLVTESFFNAHRIKFTVSTPSLQKFYRIFRRSKNQRQKLNLTGTMTWNHYYSPTEIYAWLDVVVQQHFELASLKEIGKTFEGRSIKVVKICRGGCGKASAVLIDAGIHGREWSSISTATYIINQLLFHSNLYSTILDDLDVYIVPVLNVDGYEYSWKANGIPWWRKNRRVINGSRCVGVDLNRNFAFGWGKAGSSHDPCANTFVGEAPFSEPETQALRDFVLDVQNNGTTIEAYISLHSFGQYWLTPYGFKRQVPKDYNELTRMANFAVAAIKRVHGKTYRAGSSSALAGLGAGGSDDWMKGTAGIKYSYTIEMRPSTAETARGDATGFLLPVQEIQPVAHEVWTGIQTLLDHLMGKNKDSEEGDTEEEAEEVVVKQKEKGLLSLPLKEINKMVSIITQ